jgi:hypothetical protein
MRKLLLPLAVCAAVVVLVLFARLRGEDPQGAPPAPPPVTVAATPKEPDRRPLLVPRSTRTSVAEHQWLSELERALGREDLSQAHWFRQKVCEDLDTVLASEKLRGDLWALIAEHAGSDPGRRDVVLPILRVLRTPEATAMIKAEYYRAKDEQEREMLLDAMARAYHDPEQAAVWAVERALSGETAEIQDRAFDLADKSGWKPDLVVNVATQILESTTRPEQRREMLRAIGVYARDVPDAQALLRRHLSSPRGEEILTIATTMILWATEDDAARLEALAAEFPAHADFLRDHAQQIRMHRQAESPPD